MSKAKKIVWVDVNWIHTRFAIYVSHTLCYLRAIAKPCASLLVAMHTVVHRFDPVTYKYYELQN